MDFTGISDLQTSGGLLMSHDCSHDNCFLDITCALGHLDKTQCEYWSSTKANTEEDSSLDSPLIISSCIPWNGYALGKGDLAILSCRTCPLVIGLIGSPDAGKTSLLAYLYMWLLKYGELEKSWRFAGSWTLGGWESIVSQCRWIGSPPPSFPPHTSSTGRHPGLLHVTFRTSKGNLRDVLFTDAPGEWFMQWAKVPGAPEAEGARWIIEQADAILLLLDSAALHDPVKLPDARRKSRDLIDRISATILSKPSVVVWTKSDIKVAQHTLTVLQQLISELMPQSPVLQTTIHQPETIIQCFLKVLSLVERHASYAPIVEERLSNDSFLAFRGTHKNA
jgi:hypothetical protein